MKNIAFISGILFIPALTFADGVYLPPVTSETVAPIALEETLQTPIEPVMVDMAEVYEPTEVYTPVVIDPMDVSSIELAPTAEGFDSLDADFNAPAVNTPMWMTQMTNHFIMPIDRTTNDGLSLYQEKQNKAQLRLLKYRTFMR